MLSLQENQRKNLNIYMTTMPNIKLKIMLYKPFMLNMVWKSTERFGKVWIFEMDNV